MLKSTTLIDTMKLETGKTFVEVGPGKRDRDDIGGDEKLPSCGWTDFHIAETPSVDVIRATTSS
jgi:hypothetical protein